MIIVLNKETLTRNIEYNQKPGSNAGDVILNQDANAPKDNEYKISDFNNIPDITNLHNHKSLLSKKSNSVIHKVFVFDKFQVNGMEVDIDKKFIIFIRESGNNPTKLRLICQGMNRKIEDRNIDNGEVLDEISTFLNNKPFSVQALEYKEKINTLNFIIFLYGEKNKSSEVFRDTRRIQRKLRGYNITEIRNWSNMEFVSHFIRLIRRYDLEYIVPLLSDKMYCSRNLNMQNSFFNKDKSDETYIEKIFLFNKEFYVPKNLSNNSKLKLWDLLLDRIEAIADEVIYETESKIFKGIKIPDNIIFEENRNILVLKFDNDKTKIRNYLYNQNIYEGNKVLLLDEKVTKIKRYSIYKVASMREEAMILEKTEMIVNIEQQNEMISKIKGEMKNGY